MNTLTGSSELPFQELWSFVSDVSLSAPEFLEDRGDLGSRCLFTRFFTDMISRACSGLLFFFTELSKWSLSIQAIYPADHRLRAARDSF